MADLDTVVAPPPHVPRELVFDFDFYHPDGYQDDVHLAWKRVQDRMPDIFWTPHYGGHWVALRGDDIKHMQQDYACFSHREMFLPKGVIPFQLPVQLDPPAHTPYRKLFMPAFLPRALEEVDRKARATAIDLIEQIAARGHCEFVGDFAGAMPIIAFLTMMDLPQEDYRRLRGYAVYMSKPIHPKSAESWAAISQYIAEWIERRRQAPGEDLISRIVQGQIQDRPLDAQEVFGLCLLMLGGGLDTVVSMTTFMANFLAGHPAHRRQLIERPELIDTAVEEFVRRFGTTNTARQITQDMTYKGVPFRENDIIVLANPLTGMDERENADPLAVDFERAERSHATFGSGPHTCPGAVLARRELKIFLQEWLKRIPDFWIKPGTRPVFTTGVVNALTELHLEWNPA
jgi:cytochrome P450